MYLDLYRANLAAIAAETGGVAEVFKVFHAAHVRGDDRPDGPAVGRVIAVPANVFVDGAGI